MYVPTVTIAVSAYMSSNKCARTVDWEGGSVTHEVSDTPRRQSGSGNSLTREVQKKRVWHILFLGSLSVHCSKSTLFQPPRLHAPLYILWPPSKNGLFSWVLDNLSDPECMLQPAATLASGQ